MNKPINKANKSGVKGVNWHKRTKKYIVRVEVNDRKYHVGYFTDLEAAKRARDEAAAELHGEFMRK